MNIPKEMAKQACDRMALRREMQKAGVKFTDECESDEELTIIESKVIKLPYKMQFM